MKRLISLPHLFKLKYYSYLYSSLPYPSHEITIPLIGILLFLASLLSTVKRECGFMDTGVTNQMKGLAILAIIFYHYVTWIFNTNAYYPVAHALGTVGVAAFLTLSGFGITMSYVQKGLGKNYLLVRFLRILVPFWAVGVVILLLDGFLLQLHFSPLNAFVYFLGIIPTSSFQISINPSMWFVTYILFFYVIFFLIFKQKVSMSKKVLAILLVAVLVEVVIGRIPRTTSFSVLNDQWAHYSLCFPIGVLIAATSRSIRKFIGSMRKSDVIFLYLVLFVFCAFYEAHLTLLAGFIVILPLLALQTLGFYSRFLAFIGTISYELYLIHFIFLVNYDFLNFRKPQPLFFIVYFILICLLAYMAHKYVNLKSVLHIKQRFSV